MIFKKLNVSNFKSFDEFDIELENLNILIGANGAGKTNFINVFRFIRDIILYGFENAISLQGGINYLVNVNNGFSKDLKITYVFDVKGIKEDVESNNSYIETNIKNKKINITQITYTFGLKFYKRRRRGKRIRNIYENFIVDFNILDEVEKNNEINYVTLDQDRILFTRYDDAISAVYDDTYLKNGIDYDTVFYLRIMDIFKKQISMNNLFFPNLEMLPLKPFKVFTYLKDIILYDLDPKLPKKSIPIEAKSILNEDGNNLAIVLNNILQQDTKLEEFFYLIKDMLPFIDRFSVEKISDQSLISRLKEIYSEKHNFPASLVSEGTFNITLLIISIFFEKNEVVFIEEPFKRVHAKLIAQMMKIIKEISIKKQIFLTTHNSEVMKYANLKELITIERNENGNSIVKKGIDLVHLEHFLKNNIGLDMLYIKDIIR